MSVSHPFSRFYKIGNQIIHTKLIIAGIVFSVNIHKSFLFVFYIHG